MAGTACARRARELDATQQAQLSEAETWMLSNPQVSRLLASDPLRLVLGDFELSSPSRGRQRLLSGVLPAPRSSATSSSANSPARRAAAVLRQLYNEVRDTLANTGCSRRTIT